MHLEIITPDKKLFEDEVKSITVPGIDGSLGILENHAPLISALKKGVVRITDNTASKHFFEIEGGVIEVLHNRIIILAE